VGTGIQARSHAKVLVYARTFQEVRYQMSFRCRNKLNWNISTPFGYHGDVLQIRVWGRSEDKAKKYVDDIKAANVDSDASITIYPVLQEAVSGADVVVVVTMGSEPVLFGEWVKPGALVCCKYVLYSQVLAYAVERVGLWGCSPT